MYERFGRNYSEATDSLADDASSSDPCARWGNGVGFAAIPLAMGLASIIHQSSYFLSRRGGLAHYTGSNAVALGIAWIGIAAFMHGHYFWSVSDRSYFVSQLLKPLALLTVSGAIGYVVVQIILFG